MSETNVEIKPEKRERDEGEAEPAVVKEGSDVPVPAAKKLKAADGEEAATGTAEAAPAEDSAVPAVAAAAPVAMDEETKAAGAETEAAPAPVSEEKKAAGAAEAEAAPAPVSEETKKEKEAEALKMLEFYFGDSNFGWDRFMKSKAGKMGENLIDVSILMTFNKLKNIVKDAGLSTEGGLELIARLGEESPNLRVSEDKKQIGRAEPLTEESEIERVARTVQTKGYKKDAKITIPDVEKLFAETGKCRYVKICRASRGKLTSIFVEFEAKEEAEKSIAQSEKYSHGGEVISVRPAKRDEDKATPKETSEPTPEPVVYEAGKIIHIVDIPESGVSRESLRDAVSSFGTAVYIDFSFGVREAWLRMANASEAAAAVEASKAGLELAPEVEQKGTVSLLEGDEEKTYYENLEMKKAERFSNRKGRGGGRGKGKRGKGRGGGGRGRGRGRGGGGGDN